LHKDTHTAVLVNCRNEKLDAIVIENKQLCILYMPSLSGTQMFNANGKFANIVVWQREPLCAAVSCFVTALRWFTHSAKIKPHLAAFCERIFSFETQSKMFYVTLIYGVNHGIENCAG